MVTNATVSQEAAGGWSPALWVAVFLPVLLVILGLLGGLLLARAGWRARRSKKSDQRYEPVPTAETQAGKPVIGLQDPAVPSVAIELPNNFSRSDPRRHDAYLPHRSPGLDETSFQRKVTKKGGGASLHLSVKHIELNQSLVVDVRKATGIPSSDDLFLSLTIVSRDGRNRRRSSSTGNPTSVTKDYVCRVGGSVQCGPISKKELARTSLSVQVLDGQMMMLAATELPLASCPYQDSSIPLRLATNYSPVQPMAKLLVSLQHNNNQLMVTMLKMNVFLHDSPAKITRSCSVKVSILKDGECLLKAKTKSVPILPSEVELNETFTCNVPSASDLRSYQVECTALLLYPHDLMKKGIPLGTVTLGSHVPVKQAKRQWDQLVDSKNNITVAEWHNLTADS